MQALEGYLEPVVLESAEHPLAAVAEDVQWGKLWTPKENSILSWSIRPKNKTHFFFFQQSGTQGAFLPLCIDAFISLVTYEDAYLLIKFEASEVEDFVFTIVFPHNEVRFSHDFIRDYMVGKAEPTQLLHLETRLLPNLSSPKAFVRSYVPYTAQIWKALSDFETAKGKGKGPMKRTQNLSLAAPSGTAPSGLGTPEVSLGGQSSKRPNPDSSSSGSKRSKSKLSGSALTFMNPTMNAAVSEKEINYAEATKALKDYWEKCADCYVFGRDNPVDVSISLLDPAEPRFIVRSLEPTGIAHYKNILMNSLDVSSRQTIIIMPKIQEAPETWNWESLVQSCRFRLIDGQHHVEAAKELIRDRKVDDSKFLALQTWRAHVVWHTDTNKILDVSAMANKTNNAGTFTPSWATNIMGSRSVWKDYGRPVKVKKPHRRETAVELDNRERYEVRELISSLMSMFV